MNAWKLTTGNLTAGCCRLMKPSNEYTMPVVVVSPGSYLSEGKHKWKTANGTQLLPAAHVCLDITCNESHTSPVWMGSKWCSSNEPASLLNVFTLHTPLWWCWCERLQVSIGDEDCQWRRGDAVLMWDWEKGMGMEPQLIGNTVLGGQGTWLIRYGPLHLLYWAAC